MTKKEFHEYMKIAKPKKKAFVKKGGTYFLREKDKRTLLKYLR